MTGKYRTPSGEWLPNLGEDRDEVDVMPFAPKRPAVRTSLWRTLWYVVKGRRVYVR